MINMMKARTQYKGTDGKIHKQIEDFEGRAFEHKGIALHIRKSGSCWILSLFNSGVVCWHSGKTIREAIEYFDTNEGAVIDTWKYERGSNRLRDYQTLYFGENTSQIIDLTYYNGKIVIGEQIRAGNLI